MFCHRCGARIADGAAYCHKCGTKVVYEDTEGKNSADPEEESPLQESEASSNPELENPDQIPTGEPSKIQTWWGNCSKAKRILVVLAALFVGGFGLCALVIFLQKFGYLLLGIAVVGGFILTLVTGSEKEKIETKKTIVQLVVGGLVICIIAIVIVSRPDFFSDTFYPGATVRNAYLSQYSETITIEEAFNGFFENGKWDTYKENGYSYVVFTGACEYLGKRADAKVTFKITGENFLVDGLDVNGMPQNDLVLYGLLSQIYEND